MPLAKLSPVAFALAVSIWMAACASPRNMDVANSDASGDTGRIDTANVGGTGGTGGRADAATSEGGTSGSDAGIVSEPDVVVTIDQGGIDQGAADAGSCTLNETRCTGNNLEACDAVGKWAVKMACPSACQAGACTGECRPDSKRCGASQTPETCNTAGQWVPGTACPLACTGAGVCGGSCVPEAKRCAGTGNLQPELCDSTGTWKANGAACPNVCSSGSCGGSCPPTTKRCGTGSIPETCSPQGTWEPGTACPFVCTGTGNCTGSCRPNSRDCSGKIPRKCNATGVWENETACTIACVGAGTCAVCEPVTAHKCNGATLQVCKTDGSGFQDEKTCPNNCNTMRLECNACTPNRSTCVGMAADVCRIDGSGTVRTECANACGYGLCSGQCVAQKDFYCVAADDTVKPVAAHCELHASQDTTFECKPALSGTCQFDGGQSIFIYSTTNRTSWMVGTKKYICAGNGGIRSWRELPNE